MKVFFHFLLGLTILAFAGCDNRPDLGPKTVSYSDTNFIAMLKAMNAVDRTVLGFTPVSTNANIRLEFGSESNYDAMLHIYADTQRTIAFRKTPDGYRWIGEQEIHYGPKSCTDHEGNYQEHLVIEFQTEPVNGQTTNQIMVSYYGEDTRLKRRNLKLNDIRPILKEWEGTQIR